MWHDDGPAAEEPKRRHVQGNDWLRSVRPTPGREEVATVQSVRGAQARRPAAAPEGTAHGDEAMKVPATIDERRALRGLVRHARRVRARSLSGDPRSLSCPPPPGRGRRLVYQVSAWKKPVGTCVWCGDPTGPRRWWHRRCADVYIVARGQVRTPEGAPSLLDAPCEICGRPGTETDHRDSLGSAARSGSWRRLIRAYTHGNLRRLCRECHATKTRRDRCEQAALTRGDRREQADLASPQMVLPGLEHGA